MDKAVVSALGIPIMARFQILKGSTSTWSTLRSQLVYFRTTCFYNPMKYCILLSFHININFLDVFQTSPFCPYQVPDIATWSYQTRVFHLLITSWHISSSLFHIGSFRCVQSNPFVIYQKIICNENELPSSPREISELPSSWSGVTSFPVNILNCHISEPGTLGSRYLQSTEI